MTREIITLITDFGEKSGYTGVMKGVIYSLYPAALPVDITHLVQPQNIREGAFLLHTIYKQFPPGTIHLAVVDPGVGTARRAVALHVPEIGYFIGPDNGLFSYIIESYAQLEARQITNPAFMRHPVSATFHGRDIFAPTAALLGRGEPFEEVGPPVDVETLVVLENNWGELGVNFELNQITELRGEIVHVDHFGNLISNIHRDLFEVNNIRPDPGHIKNISLVAPNSTISLTLVEAILETYGKAAPGDIVVLFGSSGFLEIARVNGRADNFVQNQLGLYGQMQVIVQLAV